MQGLRNNRYRRTAGRFRHASGSFARYPSRACGLRLLGWVAAVLGALVAAATAGPTMRSALMAAVATACVGALLEGRRAMEHMRQARAVAAAVVRREALRTRRRERAARNRDRRRARVKARSQAALSLANARSARREMESLAARRDTEARGAAHRDAEAEATRLAALTDSALTLEMRDLFECMGWSASHADHEYDGDFVLRRSSSPENELVRCLPGERAATAADVRAANNWRADSGAARVTVIALRGFTPAAVDSARGLPVVLAEPYLLSQWRMQCTPS